MRIFIYLFFSCTILGSCHSQPNYNFRNIELGGEDKSGYLYQKRYFSEEEDTNISYTKWKGVEVSSNEELEALLKAKPLCEAIRFKYWNNETNNEIELSKKIGQFKNLRFLEIYSNRITKYPSSIEQLAQLEEISLHLRNKEEIDFSFSNFQKLKHLTIVQTDNTTSLPISIQNCKNLETLKLCGFLHKENLEGIQNLVHLKEIFLWDSNITLPLDASYQFYQLETLIVGGNLETIPEYFFDKNTIKRLAITGQLDTMDLNVISKMKNLKTLSLVQHKELSGDLVLPGLEHLSITSFSGEAIDIKFGELTSLESLVVWGCRELNQLSDISNPNLRSITINTNNKLKILSFDEKKMTSIEEAIIRYNSILENQPTMINGVAVKGK